MRGDWDSDEGKAVSPIEGRCNDAEPTAADSGDTLSAIVGAAGCKCGGDGDAGRSWRLAQCFLKPEKPARTSESKRWEILPTGPVVGPSGELVAMFSNAPTG